MQLIKNYIILLLLLAITNCSIAQQNSYNDEEVQVDAPAVESTIGEEPSSIRYNSYDKRYYNEERIAALKEKKEFQYVEEPFKLERSTNESGSYYETDDDKTTSSRRQSRGNENNKARQNRSNSSASPKDESKPSELHINWLFVVLIGIGIILAVLYFSGFNFKTFGRKGSNADDLNKANIDEEHIDNIKFETEVEKAIRLKNFKLAVRLLYLENLKMLNDAKKIDWKINKTNWDYVRELQKETYHKDFVKITNAFDYVWYGNFSLDESTFQLMREQMDNFKIKIK